MLNIRLEHLSPLHVRFPSAEKRSDVITLGKRYIAQEQTRPTKQQNLFTPTINSLLQQILDYEKKIAAGEAQRAVAADAVPALEQRSKELVTSMMKTIDAAFPHWPAKAQEWGFATKKETGNILTPKTQKDRLAVMETYIAKEESRPEEERFTIPALADVIDNYQTYRATIQARDTGQYQRETHINASNELVKQLAQYLQLAAGVLVGQDYKLKISKDLQHWGYTVVERRRSNKAGSSEAAPAETNGSDEDNGLLDIDVDGDEPAG
ncbi:MAG: hypothetical protein KDI02_25175 [Anaerolineae bacterium]|nr:hypothetical protein [Anaerolineae bacterium]MCB9107070.1 hypothetical protein [Anaerolineales bacterium]